MSKPGNTLYKVLQEFPRKRITLEELGRLCSDPEQLIEQIKELNDKCVLVPVKSSGTNGNQKNPLFMRYTICIENTIQVSPDEIYALHPRLSANGYLLRNRMQFVNNRAFLCRLSEWLTNHKGNDVMSRRERSFSIFGEEKELDNHLKLLEAIGLSGDTLKYYETPEQCFSDYIPVRKQKMTLLICENKDIWFNIRRLMYESGVCSLFDIQIDGVIFGQGNDITGKDKFRSYSAYLGAYIVHFLYCGDIDRAGFDIFLRLCKAAEELHIELFLPAYRKMLELSRNIQLPDSEDRRCIIPKMSDILPMFQADEQKQITQILQDNKRLPQEILSYPVLADNMR
ncbi:MAG: hypothetical protein IJ666_00020 [Ruminococcus sp.]|nr:hypothetical protein [Ruminococcus sp.]